MRAVDAYESLRRFGKPVFTTEDAAMRMRTTLSAASRTLSRLASTGLIQPLRHGLWSLSHDLDPLVLPEHLTAPFPAYVSLQSALYFHGMSRPESCAGPAGESPVAVIAGEPRSRLQPGGEILSVERSVKTLSVS